MHLPSTAFLKKYPDIKFCFYTIYQPAFIATFCSYPDFYWEENAKMLETKHQSNCPLKKKKKSNKSFQQLLPDARIPFLFKPNTKCLQ